MDNKDIVASTSDDAAQYRTDIKGWVSRHGRFYGDNRDSEDIARYDGCTHRPCDECGVLVEKRWTHCIDCREKRAIERWNKREKKKWEEDIPLYSDYADRYFCDADELQDYMDDNDISSEKLRLVICDNVYLSKIDLDYWYDELVDDAEPSKMVLDAIDALNQAIVKEGPVSFVPGKYAAIVNDPLFMKG